MLESKAHSDSAFVTLTYDEEHLPPDGSLRKDHARNWLKRIRARVAPTELRFYMVGEYGDHTWRPHYHAALFGYPTCLRERTEHRYSYCCKQCDLLQSTWKFGSVDLGQLNNESAQYIAGYVTKKLTNGSDKWVQEKLNGRSPEFARMSLKPGIGAPAMKQIIDSIKQLPNGVSLEDVPGLLMHGPKKFPLGRYLKNKIREGLGLPTGTPEEVLFKYGAEMRVLFEKTLQENGWPKVGDLSKIFVDTKEQEYLNLQARTKIYGQKRGLI